MAALKTVLMSSTSVGSSYKHALCLRTPVVSLYQPAAGLRQSVAKKLGLPEKPKKPLTAFSVYFRNHFSELKKLNPDKANSELFRLAAQKFRQIDKTEQMALQNDVLKMRTEYFKALEDYKNKLTSEDIFAIQNAEKLEKALKEKNVMKKKLDSLGMPKVPYNSFGLFAQEWRVKNPSKEPVPETTKRIAKLWNELADQQKEKYNLEAKKLREKYKEDLARWEEKMISEGKLELFYDVELAKKKKAVVETKHMVEGTKERKTKVETVKAGKTKVESSKK